MKWKKIAWVEYRKIVFHSIASPADHNEFGRFDSLANFHLNEFYGAHLQKSLVSVINKLVNYRHLCFIRRKDWFPVHILLTCISC